MENFRKAKAMEIINNIPDMQRKSAEWRREEASIGLVPTMGYLHEGHKALIRSSVQRADKTAVSIFVNPAQFGPSEDYDQYPRDFQRDEIACEEESVDVIFAPDVKEMYPDDFSTWVVENSLSQGLCGAFRPGHFKGVVTVVTKLFNAVQPDLTVFGQKDAQQALIIQRMIRDLNFGINFVLGPIVRAGDGLALSCRNAYLNADERKSATSIYQGLTMAHKLFEEGERQSDPLKGEVTESIEAWGGRIEYVEVARRRDLQIVEDVNEPAMIAVAAYFGKTRLIDNVFLEP